MSYFNGYLSDVMPAVGKAFNESRAKHSDEGSCVLGYKMFMNDTQVCPQPYQGSIGCENVYDDMRKVLIDIGYNPQSIRIEYGRMD